jgi:hypothetical protein
MPLRPVAEQIDPWLTRIERYVIVCERERMPNSTALPKLSRHEEDHRRLAHGALETLMATASMFHGNAGQLPYLVPMIGSPRTSGAAARLAARAGALRRGAAGHGRH